MLKSTIIGKKITEARKKINISQAQLAELLFISPQAVGKWERGKSLPDLITLNQLAGILGVDLNYFSESFQPASTEIAPGARQSAESSSEEQSLNSGKTGKKPRWDMSRGNWVDADFSGLKNLNEKFSSSNMQRCRFAGSDLSGLLLNRNNVDSCDFSGSGINKSHVRNSNLGQNKFNYCSLQGTEFSGSNLTGCDFNDSSLKEAEFSESYIMGCDFSGADLTGTTFKSGGFQDNTMASAVLKSTSFKSMQIIGIVFDGTLDDCYFENCVFKKVTFRKVTLTNTFFKNKSLKGIRFEDCYADRMTYEFLKSGKADLSGITLRG